jgi:hypothetical protein
MVDTVRNYDNSYDYGSVIHKQKSNKLNKIYKIVGGILLLLSIFVLYKLPDQDGNWTLAAWSLIVSVALFTQIKETAKHE